MKIYIAAKFENKTVVRRLHSILRDKGYEITHDWTTEELGDRTGVEATSYLRRCAELDVKGVRDADIVLLINDPKGFGLMVELGIAIAERTPVVVIGANLRDTPFFYLDNVICAHDERDAMRVIDDLTGDSGLAALYFED